MKYPLISKRITEIMNEKDMRAQDLANASGVSKASISQYVNGTNCPSSLTAKKLGEVLGVSPMWLMGMDYDRHGRHIGGIMMDSYVTSLKACIEPYKDDKNLEYLIERLIIYSRSMILGEIISTIKDMDEKDLNLVLSYVKKIKGGDES